ncbi:hypothetical protein [Aliidiomarina maris]|uniref:Uncharacterized protein n=1 Tax=Aliidiomarina maris TaxID=531312 RepID=A0A327XBK9_9GAMM|nr:hypothetical protein [Aliidiomarina maris]RAK01636.1 hypothetical protein B0I24_101259 [Aliidiomarina maris]RUO28460.1 hypothetical protein CWE07_01235 [Aliidiomarina maris]
MNQLISNALEDAAYFLERYFKTIFFLSASATFLILAIGSLSFLATDVPETGQSIVNAITTIRNQTVKNIAIPFLCFAASSLLALGACKAFKIERSAYR